MSRARALSATKLLPALGLALIVVVAISLHLGSTPTSPRQVLAALFGSGTWAERLVVLDVRLPRTVVCILIGGGLATAGVLLQGLSRNDLASPATVGVDAGAGLGMMLLLAASPAAAMQLSPWMPVAAVAGALATTLFVFAVAYQRGGVLPSRLLLVGIAVGFGANAAMLLLALRMDFVTYSYVVSWMSGTVAGTDWKSIRWLAAALAVLLPVAFGRARVLNLFALGDEAAASLGVAVARERVVAMCLATTITSFCVAVGGQIGFLGLVAPHLARRLVGLNHGVLFPAAALCGAMLLVIADSLGRTVFAPIEMPAGVFVGVLGGCYFLYLLAISNH